MGRDREGGGKGRDREGRDKEGRKMREEGHGRERGVEDKKD